MYTNGMYQRVSGHKSSYYNIDNAYTSEFAFNKIVTSCDVKPHPVLTTPESLKWLDTPAGRKWLTSRAGFNWLETPAGMKWLLPKV